MTAKETELQTQLNELLSNLNQAEFLMNNLRNQIEVSDTRLKSAQNQTDGLKNLLKRLQPICKPRSGQEFADIDQKAMAEMAECLGQ